MFLINAVIGYATHATAPPLPSGTVQPTQSVLSKGQNHSSRPGICHIAFANALYRIQHQKSSVGAYLLQVSWHTIQIINPPKVR